MAKRSITDCQWAISIVRSRDMTTRGWTVTLGDEKLLITELKMVNKQ